MQRAIKGGWLKACLSVILLLAAVFAFAEPDSSPVHRLGITVVDENGVAVPHALVILAEPATGSLVQRRETDFNGRCDFPSLKAGNYQVRIERLGFYRFDLSLVAVPETSGLDVRLTHEQEIRETVDVMESPPAIDPQKTSDTETLNQREILNVPYPTTRDIRNAMPMIPGVVMDRAGQIHVGGASRSQTLSLLDGFDVSDPVAGFLEMRVNADAVRTIDMDSGRYTVQYGHGDSVLGLNTGIGDDRLRFAATNFIPSFQQRKGFHFNQWVPRAIVSGPIERGKAWFYLAPEVEYSQTIVTELPDGADRARSWRTGNLAKIQVNLTNSNILMGEFLFNNYHAPHAGLSPSLPLETTWNQRGGVYVVALKDQQYFKSGILLENGFAVNDFSGRTTPLGNVPYVLNPEMAQGSFYARTFGSARRLQWISNVYLPPVRWHGRHEFRTGADLTHLNYHRTYARSGIAVLREDNSLARQVVFGPRTARAFEPNLQAAVYAQDRWSPIDRLIVESGFRIDWDTILEHPVVAPRVSTTYILDRKGDTKLSGGAGLFYLATNLDLISRPRTGMRIDTFLAPDGATPLGPPIVSHFLAQGPFKQPRSLSWSLGVERRLPKSVYLQAEFLDKHVTDGLAYAPLAATVTRPPGPASLPFLLTNNRQDHYQALTLTMRHSFRNVYPLLVAYTRSSARTNALIDYSVDNLQFGPQQAGRLPWDTPNRVLAWGWFPFFKKIEMGYSVDWHDGFPFSAVTEQQLIAGEANSYRFPRYFTLAIAAERRFYVRGVHLGIRATAENVTGHANPSGVINNVDSPQFLTFNGFGHRALSGRIRFLGRSKKDNDPALQQQP